MDHKALPLAELKKIVADCFEANPWIYWGDFLLSALIAWGSFFLTEMASPFSLAWFIYFVISAFAFYRAALFVHELTHQERRELPGFSFAYNLLIGIPILVPSFMYRGVHIDHHRKATYGTDHDGEYLPLGASPPLRTILYVCQSFLIPVLLLIRFLILTPLSFLHPKIRNLVMLYTSSFAIRGDTPRRLPTGTDLRHWYILEAACFLWCLFLVALFASGVFGMNTIVHIYLLLFATFIVNSLRTIVAHRYRNRSAEEISFTDQFLDSVNVEGSVVGMELLAPVGLRYHALHHLFPNMPYHNLGVAHRRLCRELPSDSIYHQATEPSFASALANLWHNSRASSREETLVSGSV